MRSLKLLVKTLLQAIQYSIHSVLQLSKGQLPRYEILQLSHRLEKGLLIENPKPLWGWEKAHRIADLLRDNDDVFSNDIGKGVLKAYIDAKCRSGNKQDEDQARFFLQRNKDLFSNSTKIGGVFSLEKNDLLIEEKSVVEKLFNTRHSTRDFLENKVSKKDIEAAIALAIRCPSACNRQVTHCYVYQSRDLQQLFLTVDVRAYDIGEFNDWVVSPSIFAAYLTLSLHLYGIGSCIYRKQLYGKKVNQKIREKCGIPENEMIVLELQFGYYKESFDVPVSARMGVNDVTTFIER